MPDLRPTPPPAEVAARTATPHARDEHAGIFAAGDVRYPSVNRVASAVGEGATAMQLVHEYLAESTAR